MNTRNWWRWRGELSTSRVAMFFNIPHSRWCTVRFVSDNLKLLVRPVTKPLATRLTHIYQVQQQSNPLKLFAVFSATAWDFSVKFSVLVSLSYLHLTANRHSINLKYDKVIDIFAWPLMSHTLSNFTEAIFSCMFHCRLMLSKSLMTGIDSNWTYKTLSHDLIWHKKWHSLGTSVVCHITD